MFMKKKSLIVIFFWDKYSWEMSRASWEDTTINSDDDDHHDAKQFVGYQIYVGDE